MWSPKTRKDGARNQFYENMREVAPGDVVFSYCDTVIKSVGIATGLAQTRPKPDFGSVGANWSREGWFIPVDYCALEHQIRPKDHMQILRPFLPTKYSPLQASGRWTAVRRTWQRFLASLADALIALIGGAYWEAIAEIKAFDSMPEASAFDEDVADRTLVGPTFREQLVRAQTRTGRLSCQCPLA